MHRPTLAAIFLSTSLLAGSAWAQATPTAPSANVDFVTTQSRGEFKASKFVGIDVYGNEGEKIGDVSEILLDGQGSAKAVVIGVGGFLGIGQKNVAVPWSAVTWSNEPAQNRTSAADRPTTTGSTGTSAPATTGAAPAATPSRTPGEQAAFNGYPDHAKVALSKAQLQSAPAFKYVADTANGTTKN